MKPAHLTLAAAALAVIGVAVWLLSPEQEETDAALFPELTLEVLNKVNHIEVTERSTSVISVYLADDGLWRVPEHHDYPADTVKVRQLLSDIKDAEKVERKTASPEHYAILGVADPVAEEGGKLLRFRDADQTWGLIVGNPSRQVSRGQYVRKPDEAESWLVNVNLHLPDTPSEWLDTEVVHVEPNDVSTVTLSHSDGEPFTVARGTDGQLAIRDLPQGRVLKDAFRLNRILSATDYLKFKQVFPRGNNEVQLPNRHITAQLATLDGLTLTVRAYKTEENDAYFTLDADGTSTQAQTLKLRLSKWLYQVSGSVYENLDKRLDNLLEDAAENKAP